MNESRTELILQTIVTTLDGLGKPAGLTVQRSRRQPVAPRELPLLSVLPGQEEAQRARPHKLCPLTDRWLTFKVRARVVGELAALDPFRQWILAALLANASLGGLALDLEEQGTEWEDIDASDADYAQADMSFRVRYTTSRNDLTRAA
jgi:hypothetical protein